MRFNLVIPCLLSSFLLTTGCSNSFVAANTITTETYLSQITFSNDPFTKLKVLNGGLLKQTDNLGVYSTYLRAVKDADNDLLFQLNLVNYHHGNWIFYNSAYDDSGTKLALTRVSEKTGYCGSSGCSKYETFNITFTKNYLESKKDTGLTIKVIGKEGSSILAYPSEYIKAMLIKVNDMN